MFVLIFIIVTSVSGLVSNQFTREDVLSNAVEAMTHIVLKEAYPMSSRKMETNILSTESHSSNVLLDLPPQKENSIRVFLCRHGQTENNRLHIVQGARVDPSLNDKGRRMAVRLGQVFATLNKNNNSYHGLSTRILHSKLQRSKETALIASLILNDMNDSSNSSLGMSQTITKSTVALLDSLGEVDFGANCEGERETQNVRMAMRNTYAAWALGDIDVTNSCRNRLSDTSYRRVQDEGETGRSVLLRAASTLTHIIKRAQSENATSIIAVSHSVFLRTLLSLVMDIPLFEASILQQENGCINVLDLDASKGPIVVGKRSHLFLGKSPDNFSVEMPCVKVLRINETRHLHDLF